MSSDTKMFLRPLHVVHIDDSRTTLLHVVGVLTAVSYPQFVVHSFDSQMAAEEWMGGSLRDQLDCVLLDLHLVETSGVDTFLRAIDLFKSVPIVVLSATFDADMACQLIYHGAESCISKAMIDDKSLPFFIAQAIARKSRPPVSPTMMRDAVTSLLAVQERMKAANKPPKDGAT